MRVDSDRLQRDLATMARFTVPGLPWTRRPFTPEYAATRSWLREEMARCGLQSRLAPAGNLIGVFPGTEPSLPPILIGSHTDTVEGGGRFDGILGVLAGLEVVRQLRASGRRLRYTLEVVDFLAEEPTDFGVSTVGSRGMVGNLTPDLLDRRDPKGRTLREALRQVGGDPDRLDAAVRRPGSVFLYLELHIEQGPVLASRGEPLGAVSGIVGIQRYQVNVTGRPDRAGTTPMDLRRDALTAASSWILAPEKACRQTYAAPVVGTVGRIHVEPNATNVVPGAVTLHAEVRSESCAAIAEVGARIREAADRIAADRRVSVEVIPTTTTAPVTVPAPVLEGVRAACRAVTGRDPVVLPSGAGHDANQLATIAPVGMIFVASEGGRSHCPEEYTAPEHVAAGAAALGTAVLWFDQFDTLGG